MGCSARLQIPFGCSARLQIPFGCSARLQIQHDKNLTKDLKQEKERVFCLIFPVIAYFVFFYLFLYLIFLQRLMLDTYGFVQNTNINLNVK